MATPASHSSLSAWLSACLASRSCLALATPAFKASMSAATLVRTAVQFLAAVSPADLISCFTFSVAFLAAARACSLRASILSCASFSAAATASSAFLARTDKSASCWESCLAMYFLHRGYAYGSVSMFTSERRPSGNPAGDRACVVQACGLHLESNAGPAGRVPGLRPDWPRRWHFEL